MPDNSPIDLRFDVASRESSDMLEHMSTIRDYSRQCETAAEFGVYDCTSTWALLAGKPKTLVSYDVSRRVEVDEVEQVAISSGLNFKFVLASTVEVEIDLTDLLFIDSYHTYEHLKEELQLHAGKVRKFILMHDTSTFEFVDETYAGRGLWPAIEEFLAEHPEWKIKQRFTNCHGLTVLERNTLWKS